MGQRVRPGGRAIRPAKRAAHGVLAALLRAQQSLPRPVWTLPAAGRVPDLQLPQRFCEARYLGAAGSQSLVCRRAGRHLHRFVLWGFAVCRESVRLRRRRLPPVLSAAHGPRGQHARRQLYIHTGGQCTDSGRPAAVDSLRRSVRRAQAGDARMQRRYRPFPDERRRTVGHSLQSAQGQLHRRDGQRHVTHGQYRSHCRHVGSAVHAAGPGDAFCRPPSRPKTGGTCCRWPPRRSSFT